MQKHLLHFHQSKTNIYRKFSFKNKLSNSKQFDRQPIKKLIINEKNYKKIMIFYRKMNIYLKERESEKKKTHNIKSVDDLLKQLLHPGIQDPASNKMRHSFAFTHPVGG